MMNIEELPPIEGGTDKQQMFAEGVRMNFIVYVEENFNTALQAEAELVLQIRRDYKWWIDRVYMIDASNCKRAITAVKKAIVKAGSLELAIEVERKSIQAKKNAYLSTRPLGGILDGIRREKK
jgi:hypothetical protein